MKKALKITAIVLSLILVIGAVAFFITPREKLMAYVTPDVRYVTVTNAKINDTTATMDVQLEVTSKLVPVFVDSVAYDFRLYEQSVAKGKHAFTPDSKKDKIQKLAIPVTVEHEKARELIKRQVAEGEKLQAHVVAYCRIPVVGTRRFDINRQVDMAMPVLPGTDIIGVKTRQQ